MKKYNIIAFDLDGTLTNPEKGLVKSFSYTFDKMGIPYNSADELKRFIGPPLYEEWQRCFGLTPEESAKALLFFREYYAEYGWWDNEIYPGVADMLKALKSGGKKIILATSKPEVFAKKILDLFEISCYFDFIGGASSDKTRDKKHEVLTYSLDAVGATDKDQCILVGDRVYDAEGAKICGIDSLGVLYGHGSYEEIESAGFTYVCNDVSDVTKLLL